MQNLRTPTQIGLEDELADIMNRANLDIRMVFALAGDRALNAREQDIINRLKEERGEGLYSDMLYALTHRAFPSRQARHLWDEIGNHRKTLRSQLGREVGISVAAHDYLTNIAGLMKSVAIIEETKMASLENVATRDGLTGLIDQSAFKHRLKEELERKDRYGGALSLVMFDLDHFKKINDSYGHAEGDVVLREVAGVLKAQVRKMDTAARYGGEEFAVILPEVEAGAAYIFAERLRQNVQNTFIDAPYSVTISAGIATSTMGVQEESDNFIKKADAQLYAAKEAGRNQVKSASAH